VSYALFELLAITVGSISIIVTVVASLWSRQMVVETIAQGLLLLVLVGAVHKGKKGGLWTAIVASLAYIALRVPLLMRYGLTVDIAGLLLVRVFTYAAIGIGGGMLCARIRRFMARLDGTPNIDGQTQLFNQAFAFRTLRSLLLQYERYRKTFAILIISLTDFSGGDPGPDKRRSLRAVATYLRDHVRLVDEAARLDDGRFVIIMPYTDRGGARIAAKRICGGLKHVLATTDEFVREDILTSDEDLPAIQELCGAPAVDQNAQPSRVA
jgi:GGDEF domain-containing protein